jgi:hypothetical protein
MVCASDLLGRYRRCSRNLPQLPGYPLAHERYASFGISTLHILVTTRVNENRDIVTCTALGSRGS